MLIDGGDTVDADLKGGATNDIRLKLRDVDRGFVLTRNGVASTDGSTGADTLTLDHWTPGPGGQVSTAPSFPRASTSRNCV